MAKITLKTNHKEFILKTQQRFKRERHNVFTEEINKNALTSNDDHATIDSIETYPYGTRKDVVSEREEM